jgi:cytolysin-activating lysine-acyltransferase
MPTQHPDSGASANPTATHRTQLADLAAHQARRVMEKIPLLGGVCWLMLQQSGLRHTLLSELDWRVMPPLVLEQAKLYMREGAPVAYVSWARLSQAVAQRYSEAPHQLMASDWRSGEQVWLIDLVAPFGGAQEVINDLHQTVLAGQTLYQLMPDGAGGSKAVTLTPTPPAPCANQPPHGSDAARSPQTASPGGSPKASENQTM